MIRLRPHRSGSGSGRKINKSAAIFFAMRSTLHIGKSPALTDARLAVIFTRETQKNKMLQLTITRMNRTGMTPVDAKPPKPATMITPSTKLYILYTPQVGYSQ
ncbi:hypothetical protein ACFCP7_18760 [Paenibacillus elgii]